MKPKIVPSIRRPLSNSARRRFLQEKFKNRCALCGVALPFLEMARIGPEPPSALDDIENYLLLCPNCHRQMNGFQPREMEFTGFLAGLLDSTPEFRNCKRESRVGNISLDLTVEERVAGSWEPLLIECRASSFLRAREITQCIAQIDEYRRRSKIQRTALAFPGKILAEDAARLKNARIQLWDRDYLALRFPQQIKAATSTPYKVLLATDRQRGGRGGEVLIAKLAKCRPGKSDWSIYQNLVRDIFELLFTPTLDKPRGEFADESGTNRRDIILPNHASVGFWRHVREAYRGDFVVVDAKNYVDQFSKAEVLQVANYLKPHGAGMFAIIVSRVGADQGAVVTLRDLWSQQGKLVVVMTDTDVRAMLTTFGASGNPEQVISDLITEFRLSM